MSAFPPCGRRRDGIMSEQGRVCAAFRIGLPICLGYRISGLACLCISRRMERHDKAGIFFGVGRSAFHEAIMSRWWIVCSLGLEDKLLRTVRRSSRVVNVTTLSTCRVGHPRFSTQVEMLLFSSAGDRGAWRGRKWVRSPMNTARVNCKESHCTDPEGGRVYPMWGSRSQGEVCARTRLFDSISSRGQGGLVVRACWGRGSKRPPIRARVRDDNRVVPILFCSTGTNAWCKPDQKCPQLRMPSSNTIVWLAVFALLLSRTLPRN